MPVHQEEVFRPGPAPDIPSLLQYVATSDLVQGIANAMDYHPRDGFDAFLCHAPEQFSTTPTLEYADRMFPKTPKDREKLARSDGFGALVDCTRAYETLDWHPRYRCSR
jgi:hypothetical protein